MFGLSLSRSRYSRCMRSSILFLISLKSACIAGQTVVISKVRANKGLEEEALCSLFNSSQHSKAWSDSCRR